MLDETKLEQLYKNALKHKENHGCSAHPYQSGKKLAEYIDRNKPLHILEIGTGAGFSALVMALAHDKAYIDTIEKDSQHFTEASNNFIAQGVADRVNIIVGDAESLLPLMQNQYDFIFFDGFAVHYEFLPNFYRLLKPNGLLMVANNQLGSKTRDQFFSELHNQKDWGILEVFEDTTIAKKSN